MVKIIKHSKFASSELISIEVKNPKFLDAELEKHRMISSNSSSSRAIPLAKTLEAEPYIPSDIRLNESGMQGYAFLGDPSDWRKEVELLYKYISNVVSEWATEYSIHKQHLNRYLEPFTTQTKIMTANIQEWEYFLSLRDAKDADPAIQAIAKDIRSSIESSEPQILKTGEWHLPYVDSILASDRDISAARCARTSYTSHSGKETSPEEDLKLAKWLREHRHLTPFEHQATGFNLNKKHEYKCYYKSLVPYSGNFANWMQYRQSL